MKIAIQAADLDAERIDGTRVYILNLLKHFGKIDPGSRFLIYHKNKFNPELTPPDFSNYEILKKPLPFFWTQLRLCASLWIKKPQALWMPMHNIPYFKPKSVKTSVTIHDLAFKYFPEYFTKCELWKLNFLARLAITRSEKIITISESSKKDILKFYPQTREDKIKVIYHGFDQDVFSKERDLKEENRVKENLKIKGNYILYVGAIQPRKNLETLIEAFNNLKKDDKYRNLKLVLAGERAWLWGDVLKKIEDSLYKNDIITPGKIKFKDLGHLMRGADIFCYPSLYEGFGIPILEAFSAGVPVVCSNNSSLPEVAGEAALYFDGKDTKKLSDNLIVILENSETKKDLIEKGQKQMQKFSWEKCARETLTYLKN